MNGVLHDYSLETKNGAGQLVSRRGLAMDYTAINAMTESEVMAELERREPARLRHEIVRLRADNAELVAALDAMVRVWHGLRLTKAEFDAYGAARTILAKHGGAA